MVFVKLTFFSSFFSISVPCCSFMFAIHGRFLCVLNLVEWLWLNRDCIIWLNFMPVCGLQFFEILICQESIINYRHSIRWKKMSKPTNWHLQEVLATRSMLFYWQQSCLNDCLVKASQGLFQVSWNVTFCSKVRMMSQLQTAFIIYPFEFFSSGRVVNPRMSQTVRNT